MNLYVILSIGLLKSMLPLDEVSLEERIADFRQANLSIIDADKRHSAAEQLFNINYEYDVYDLVLHEDDNVAIRAAWQELAGELCVPDAIADYREERRVQVARFVGRLEGRLRLYVPPIWIEGLEGFGFDLEDRTRLGSKVLWGPESRGLISNANSAIYTGLSDAEHIAVGTGGQIKVEGDQTLLITEQEKVIPIRDTPYTAFDFEEFEDTVAVIENRGLSGEGYRLRLYDVSTGNPVEKSSISRHLTGSGPGVAMGHTCFLTVEDDYFCVWGISGEGYYLDVFDKEKTSLIFSFHTGH